MIRRQKVYEKKHNQKVLYDED
jgi:hypothetical protein